MSIGSSEVRVPDAVLSRSPTLHEHRDEEVVVGIRPEDFSSPEQNRSGGDGQLDVSVVRAESLGSELVVYFEPRGTGDADAPGLTTPELVAEATDQAPAGAPRLLTARLSRNASVRDAGPARLAIDLERLYFFDTKTGAAIGH